MGYEKIIVVGNIGSVDVLDSKTGKKYLRISVAANRGSGETKTTCWYSAVVFGKMAENIDALLRVFRVGRLILVEGRPQVEAFIKKDGSAGIDNTIIASALPTLMDAPPPSDSSRTK